jgi:cytidine deaminase
MSQSVRSSVSEIDLAVELKRHAADFLARFEKRRRHHVACAILLDDGREVLGINIVSNLGPASVCAEQVALGESLKLLSGSQIRLVLTLRATFNSTMPHEIVPPCGRCREILYEYAPRTFIATPGDEAAGVCNLVLINSLLPAPFRRRL